MTQIKNLGTEKLIPDNTDILPIQQADGTTRRITRANLLAGVGTSKYEYFDKLAFLAHFNGANGSTTITDVKGTTITKYGNSSINTNQSKFGNGSLYLDGTGDYLSFPPSSSIDILSGEDFRIEVFYYPTSLTGTRAIIGQWSQNLNILGFLLRTSGTSLQLIWLNQNTVTAGTLTLNAWNHVAVTKILGKFNVWLNGASVGAFTNTNTITTTLAFTMGNYYGATANVIGNTGATDAQGYFNELRITKVLPYTVLVPSQNFPDI